MLLHDRNTTSTGSKAQQVVLTVKFAAITLLHVEPAACSPSATASSACTWTMFCRYALPEGAGGPEGCGVLLQGGSLLQHAQQASVVQEALQLLCGGITRCTAAPHSCTHLRTSQADNQSVQDYAIRH